jgi:hypothetical protein
MKLSAVQQNLTLLKVYVENVKQSLKGRNNLFCIQFFNLQQIPLEALLKQADINTACHSQGVNSNGELRPKSLQI